MFDPCKKYLNTLSPRLVSLLSVFIGLLIFFVDAKTGFEIQVSVFYLIPIFLMVWYVGLASAATYSIVASVAWTAAETLAGFPYSHGGFIAWNTIVRTGFFAIVVILGDQLRKALNHEKSISRIDPLTSLYNSRGFYERAFAVLQALKKDVLPFTVAYIDLDNFKHINDQYGHETGDTVLRWVASVMLRRIGRNDIAARFGGDEFVLLTQNPDAESSEGMIDGLRHELLRAMQAQEWRVTFSIGVLTFHVPPRTMKDVVSMVDQLMYSVKRNGKDGISFYRYEATLRQSPPKQVKPLLVHVEKFTLTTAPEQASSSLSHV